MKAAPVKARDHAHAAVVVSLFPQLITSYLKYLKLVFPLSNKVVEKQLN